MIGFSSGRCEYRTTEDASPIHVYGNVLVAVDASRSLNNGEPAGLARWIDRLDLQAGEHVLHVGAGTGYYTALMADIVGAHGHVLAVEIDPDLARLARANLAHMSQVEVCEGDGARIPLRVVDAIFINAGCMHPQTAWLDALSSQGRMLIPITASQPAETIPRIAG
jgi:protein-L-isoaspartate(D-aspartate) O-methyltransferase